MSDTSLSDAVTRWFTDPAARQDPWSLYEQLRREDAVHYCEPLDTWVLTRYADVNKVLRFPRAHITPMAGKNTAGVRDANGEPQPRYKLSVFRSLSGEAHARMKLFMGRALSSPNVASWQVIIDDEVARGVSLVRDQGSMEMMADFSNPLALRIICRILGIPEEAIADYRRWSQEVIRGVVFNADEETVRQANDAARSFSTHTQTLVEEQRAHPTTGLISALLEARQGDDELSPEEVASLTFTTIAAGHETSGSLIANMTLALLNHPDQLQRLRDDLSLLPDAVEEALRYTGPAHWVSRYPSAPITVGDVEIGVGEHIACILASANRDPEVFPDPERFVIRRPEKPQLGFALGPHSCLGASLARTELTAAMRAVVTEFPRLELASDDYQWGTNSIGRTLTRLPLRWG